jgi:hypothetical protein
MPAHTVDLFEKIIVKVCIQTIFQIFETYIVPLLNRKIPIENETHCFALHLQGVFGPQK